MKCLINAKKYFKYLSISSPCFIREETYKGRNIMLVKIASEYVYETERQPLHLDTGQIYPLYLLHILAENGGKTIPEEHAHLAFSHHRGALMRGGRKFQT